MTTSSRSRPGSIGTGRIRWPRRRCRAEQADLVRRVKRYERLAVAAARSGDRAIALEALRANPLAGDPDRAPELLEAILAANRRLAAPLLPGWLTRRRDGTPGPTLMRREIEAIPAVVARFLDEGRPEVAAAADAIRAAEPPFVAIVARGTSDHAAIHLRYLIETELGIPTGLAAPSVTTLYGAEVRWRGGLVIAVSQSGRSPDLVAVVEAARAGGATTIAIANDPGVSAGRWRPPT